MFVLDMRTALFSFLLISLLSTMLAAFLTKQFSKRYNGVYHLFFSFLLQAVALLLILLREVIPDWMSFDLSNSISVLGIILFLVGIEKYCSQKSSLKPNLILLAVFITVHVWFTSVEPDLSIRHLNVSVAWLLLFIQAAVLLLFRLPRSGMNRIMPLTAICIAFCIVCSLRIIKFLIWGHSDDYFNSDLFDIIIIIVSQIFLILLMFSLAYMFGGKLFDDIKAEEEKFSKIFHTAPYSILLSRLSDGRIIEANRVFYEKTGYSQHEVIDKTTLDLGLWTDYNDRSTLVSDLVKNGKITEKEILLRTRSGKNLPGLLTSELLIINNDLCIFSSFEDITERKKIETEKEELFRSLAESEEKCRSFFMNSLDANFLTSPDGLIFSANPAACAMLGYTEQEICSMSRDQLMDTSDPRLSAALAERERTNRFSGELTMIRRNGEKFPVELSSVIFSKPDGKKMTSMIVRDITARILAQEELRKSKELLENLNQHLIHVRENERKNIAMALHDDLGQRLTGLCMEIAWLKKKLSDQPGLITKKIDQVNEILMETIDSVKATSSFLRPVMLFELGLIPAIESHLRKAEEQSGIKFKFRCNDDKTVPDDNISLIVYRILQETVTNIIRHSGSAAAKVRLRISSAYVVLTVQDFGKGITEEQANSSASMGIAGMKERIRGVNGEINIIGEKGIGTMISAKIPLNIKNYDRHINN